MKALILVTSIVLGFSACKRAHTCVCKDANFPDKTVKIKDTKKNAKVACDNESPILDTSYPPEPTVIGRYDCRLN